MITPAWLQAAGLVLWGLAAGQGALGALLAVVRLLATAGGVRLKLADRDLNRAVDLSSLAVLLTVAAYLVAQGLPMGLLAATSWLPAVLFPLLLIDALSDQPLRWRHLAVSLRRSAHPDAERVATLGPPYLAMTLLAVGVAAKPAAAYFWPLAGVLLAWLFVARSAQRATGIAAFALAALVAAGGGYLGGVGLQRAQLTLQDWVLDTLASSDTDPYQSQTRIGDLGRVKLSDRIAWRVEQAPPARVPLLLRSGVFTRFANGTWMARRDAFAEASAAPAGALRRLTLHGESSKGAAILPLPIDAGPIAGEAGTLRRNAYGVVRVSDAPPLLDLTVAKPPVAAAVLPPAAAAEDLALPPGFADLLQRLPELSALAQGSEQERVAGVESWFAAHFRYTLFLGDETQGRRDLERFLLTDRAGHCEYFATAAVLLLRALGIPARYVTGYSVQEYSRLEQSFLVRPRHAHAWAEALVGGRWVEIDTTPSAWLTIEEEAAPFWRPLADFMSFAAWRFAELRRDMTASGHPLAAWGLGAVLLALAAWLAFRRARKVPGPGIREAGADDPAQQMSRAELRSFRALEQELSALGCGRRLSEPPRAWMARVRREGRQVLSESRISAAGEMIEALYRKRYGARLRE